jgi:tetratricopeptide (TPR) repeat protein
MKLFFSLLGLLLTFSGSAGQDVSVLLQEARLLENAMKESASFQKYREVLKIQAANHDALVKCSELCARIGKRQPTAAGTEDYYTAAKTYARTALSLYPKSSEANCVMAMALGRLAMTKSGKEKIEAARNIRTYVDAALAYDDGNFKAWHILGRWHYELSSLNFIERAAVKVFFGGIPESSLNASIQAFEKARALAPGFVLNYLELARAYQKSGDRKTANGLLQAMLRLPDHTEDDPANKSEARRYLEEWK